MSTADTTESGDGGGLLACERCGVAYNPVLRDRFWSSDTGWTEDTEDGTEEYETLCDECHAALNPDSDHRVREGSRSGDPIRS